MEPCRHKSHPQSPSAGRCAAYRRTLHHHEQLVLQTFVQAWVWSRALCFPQHLLLIHQEDEEDQRGRGSLQLGEHTLLAICFELKMFDIRLKASLGTCERGEFDDKNLCLTDFFVSFQSESQDQVFLRWTTGETATMHILVVHAMVILLTLGPPKGSPANFYNVCNVKEHAYHSVCLQERAISTLFWTFGFLTRNLSPLPSWLTPQKRRFCCLIGWNWGWSDPRSLGWLMQVQLVIVQKKKVCCSPCTFLPFNRTIYLFPPALQDLEPQQLLLFVQSFGIPVSSMSKLLQYLDQAVSHDPQTLEENIMDKRKSADFEIYSLKIFRIYLILYLSRNRLHGPPGWSAAWARSHRGAHFPCIIELLSSSRQRLVTSASACLLMSNFS